VLKGNKPDFHVAMPPQLAKPFYESLVQRVGRAYKPDAVKGNKSSIAVAPKLIKAEDNKAVRT